MLIMSKKQKKRRDPVKIFSLVSLALFAGLIALLIASDFIYMAHWKVGPRKTWEILSSGEVVSSFYLSLITSFLTLLLVLLTAVPIGYALSRCRFPGHTLVDTVVDIPIVLPPIVLGLSMLAFFGTEFGASVKEGINAVCETIHLVFGFPLKFFQSTSVGNHLYEFWDNTEPGVDGIFGIVMCQYLVAVSYCIRAVKAAFEDVDRGLEDVALTLGASRVGVFRMVTLPLARNGLVAGGIMAWARAIGVFGPLMVFVGTGRRVQVMSTIMWLHLNIGNVEAALAVSLVTMLIAAMAILLVHKLVPGRRWV